jgi:oligoendopeptidase F
LSQSLKKNPESTREKIFSFLKSGGSKPSLEILKLAGVDLLEPTAINNAFLDYRQNVKKGEELFL